MEIVAGKAGRIAKLVERIVCLRGRNRGHSEYRLIAVIGFQSLFGVRRLMFGIPIGRHRSGSKYADDSESKFVGAVHLPCAGNVMPRGWRRFLNFCRRSYGPAPGIDSGGILGTLDFGGGAVEPVGFSLADRRESLVRFCFV